MARAKNAPARRRRRKRWLKRAKGFVGGRSRLYRTARETVQRAMMFATFHRRARKRDFRALWIIRISAGARENGMTYNRLINGLQKSKIEINRKMLAELAVSDRSVFKELVKIAKIAKSA